VSINRMSTALIPPPPLVNWYPGHEHLTRKDLLQVHYALYYALCTILCTIHSLLLVKTSDSSTLVDWRVRSTALSTALAMSHRYNINCALYTFTHYTPCTVHYILFTIHYTLCTMHYTLYTMLTIHCARYTHYTLNSLYSLYPLYSPYTLAPYKGGGRQEATKQEWWQWWQWQQQQQPQQ
jgi:hypothetical protein